MKLGLYVYLPVASGGLVDDICPLSVYFTSVLADESDDAAQRNFGLYTPVCYCTVRTLFALKTFV